MDTFKSLKIPAALLLTAGLVSATLSVAKADEQPNITTVKTTIKKKDKIIAKGDYLPDALGRVGYAIFIADQQQLENIHMYERPRTQWIYESDTLSVRNRDSGMNYSEMNVDNQRNTSHETFDLGIKDDDNGDIVDNIDTNGPQINHEPSIDSSSYDKSEVPKFQGSPESPDTPALPDTHELPDTPNVPELPDTPELPDAPNVPELPDAPDAPDAPELPNNPELPDVPELPNTPELPDFPDVPSAPELPDFPDAPNSPELPYEPELPDVPSAPELPDFPDAPNSPELPYAPELPDFPDVPNSPELPDVPDVPYVPEPPLSSDITTSPNKSDDSIKHSSSGAPLHINSDNVMDKEYREEVATIKQGQTTKYDSNLKQGETRFVGGHPGQIIKTYEDTYYNGTFSYSTLLEEKTTIEPISDILYVGSEVKDSRLSVVDLKIGDTLDHCKITGLEGDIKGYVNVSYYDLLSESEDTRFKKATASIDASYSTLDPREEEPFNHGYRWLGASDDVVTLFNSGRLVDKHKINEYLLNYINADREERGLNKLVIDPELQALVDTRAQEMASYGHIHYNGKPHTRPDGSPWSTVLEQLPTTYKSYGFVENMLAYSVLSNPHQLVSEHWIAKRLFEQWKSSGPHYAAMMDPKATRTAVSVKLTTRTGARSENGTNWMVGSQLFSK